MTGKQLKNSILQWAIQGKLVPQDPNDEPASVLLEKIRQEKERLIQEKKIKRDKNASIIFRGENNSYYEKFLATGEVKCIDEEIPFEIPQGWEWERFGNVMINRDSERIPLSVAQRQHLKKTYDYYGASGVIDKVEKYLFDKELLLIGEDGANLLNRSTPIAFIAKGKYWVNNHAHVLDVCGGMLLSYVALFINAISLVEYVTGTAQPKMNQEKMNSILLAIPPAKEQSRIIKRTSMVDTLIDKYASLQVRLDSLNKSNYGLLKKSILQEAIQGKLVPQIAKEGTARELLEQIRQEKQKLVEEDKLKKTALTDSIIYKGEDNKYWEKNGNIEKDITDEIPFEIPNSWCWMRLKNLCRITNGFTPLRTDPKFWENGTISWFTVEDIHKQGEYIYQTSQRITNLAVSNDRIVRAGSILLCCTASVGQCAMTMIPITTNQQFNALTVKDEYRCLVNDDFLYLFAKTLEPILHDLAGKTTFEFISVKKVGNILIPIPPVFEQHRICEVTNKAIAGIMRK